MRATLAVLAAFWFGWWVGRAPLGEAVEVVPGWRPEGWGDVFSEEERV